MDIGVLVQNFGGFVETGESARACVSLAQRAEQRGYASVWVTDHIVLPFVREALYPHNDTGTFPYTWDQDVHDPLILLGALATATERVRIGVAVLVIPYRHPLTTAKMLATIDQLSRGRLILGAGVGWLRDEFDALGIGDAFAERGAVTDEYLRVMCDAWTSVGPISFGGTHVAFGPVGANPKPAQQPHVPIWVGGKGPRALARTVAFGSGHLAISSTPEQLAQEVAELRAAARGAGRDPSEIAISLIDGIAITDAPMPASRAPLHGTVEQVAEGLQAYRAAGLDHLVAGIRRAGDPTYDGSCAALEAIAPLLAAVR